MNRELDKKCAEALGWTGVYHNPEANEHAQWTGRSPITRRHGTMIPRCSTDLAAARLLEDDIEARGLGDQYCIALFNVMVVHRFKDAANPFDSLHIREAWWLIRATPEQKCHAYLKTRELS